MKSSIARISELVNNLRDITSIQRQAYLSSEILDLKQSSAEPSKNGRKNVLIVDDEPDILDTIVEIINKAGYECSGASDGFEALKIIEKKNFDLIISDINMPRMSGTALFKKVREIGVECKFIFMTGYALSNDSEKTIEGSDGILHKPVDYNTILALIEKTANVLGK
jgi:DNA-binding NtrC family response regulator